MNKTDRQIVEQKLDLVAHEIDEAERIENDLLRAQKVGEYRGITQAMTLLGWYPDKVDGSHKLRRLCAPAEKWG